MQPSTPDDKWDDTFTIERGGTVTLRDSKGTLYCIQAHFLAEPSPVFQDMFSCVPAGTDPIDADFDASWTKPLLLYITGSTHLTSRDYATTFGDRPAIVIARLHLWCQKYQCSTLEHHVRLHLRYGLLSPRRTPDFERMTAFFAIAGQNTNARLLEIGCEALQAYLGFKCDTPMELVEECDEMLPTEWRGALVKSVLEYKLADAKFIWYYLGIRMGLHEPDAKAAKRARKTS